MSTSFNVLGIVFGVTCARRGLKTQLERSDPQPPISANNHI
jgi:hypothetical protein